MCLFVQRAILYLEWIQILFDKNKKKKRKCTLCGELWDIQSLFAGWIISNTGKLIYVLIEATSNRMCLLLPAPSLRCKRYNKVHQKDPTTRVTLSNLFLDLEYKWWLISLICISIHATSIIGKDKYYSFYIDHDGACKLLKEQTLQKCLIITIVTPPNIYYTWVSHSKVSDKKNVRQLYEGSGIMFPIIMEKHF